MPNILIATSTDDFAQPRALWNCWNDSEKEAFISNISGGLKLVKSLEILHNQRMLYSACQ